MSSGLGRAAGRNGHHRPLSPQSPLPDVVVRSLDGNVTGSRLRLLSFPMWRRVLGLRVMLALPLIIWLKDGVLEWLDRVRLIEDLPAWLADARGLCAGACAVSLLLAASLAIQDVAVFLMPPGKLRKIVLLGEEGKEAREALLSNDALAWKLLVIPTLLPIIFLSIYALILMLSGAAAAFVPVAAPLLTAGTRWLIVGAGIVLGVLLRR